MPVTEEGPGTQAGEWRRSPHQLRGAHAGIHHFNRKRAETVKGKPAVLQVQYPPHQFLMSKKTITRQRLMELLSYDKETGLFVWIAPKPPAKKGSIAGNINWKGYVCITIDNREYRAHRLAWLYVTGEWPANQLDHINCVKNDNKFINLREATNAQNRQNIRLPIATNTSGLLGVHKSGSKWIAQIIANGKRYYLGSFDCPNAAHAAYIAAKIKLHPFQTIV